MITPIPGVGSIGSIGSVQSGGAVRTEKTQGGFDGFLSNALNQVNELNSGAELQISNALAGRDADLSSVMVAVEKADVAFQLAMQVRNKIVSAYQDIEKMQF